MPRLYGYEVDEETARQTVIAAMTGGMPFVDTSNNYGVGRAETRIGQAIRELGGLPEGVVLASKVDPEPGSSDFSGDRVRRSVEETLERLGLDHVQLMYLHDPEDHITFEEAMAKGGAVEALVELRDEGVLGHLGVAGGAIAAMREYLTADVFEAVISHNRYTLVDRSAEPLMDDAVARGVAFVNGAPYGGGHACRRTRPAAPVLLPRGAGSDQHSGPRDEGRVRGVRRPAAEPRPCSSRSATPGWPRRSSASRNLNGSPRPSSSPRSPCPTRSGRALTR